MKIMQGHLYQLKIFHIVNYKCKADVKFALLFCELCGGVRRSVNDNPVKCLQNIH